MIAGDITYSQPANDLRIKVRMAAVRQADCGKWEASQRGAQALTGIEHTPRLFGVDSVATPGMWKGIGAAPATM